MFKLYLNSYLLSFIYQSLLGPDKFHEQYYIE